MITSTNIFHISLLQSTCFLKLPGNQLFSCYVINKRKKLKIKFKKKLKKKVILLQGSPFLKNFFINLNKTIHFNINNFFFLKKKLVYALKLKIKWYFKKFKYHGKGYKIKKFNCLSKITFRLGKSHWTKLLFNKQFIVIKRTKKNSYCCISIKHDVFNNLKNLIKKIKGANKYTKRGVRLTRQSLKKRFGKISQASSIYK